MSVVLQVDETPSVFKRFIASVAGLILVYFITLAQLPERDAMFDTSLAPVDVVKAYYDLALAQGNPAEAREKYVSPDVVDHGLTSLAEVFDGATLFQGEDPAQGLVVAGDVVIAKYKLAKSDSGQVVDVIEIFKVLAGSVIERWAVVQPEA